MRQWGQRVRTRLMLWSAPWISSKAAPLEHTLLAFILGVALFRSSVFLIRSFLPLGLPELWRQSDTLGITLRYWLRFSNNDLGAPWWAPALLQSGDAMGVNATEFPFLTLLHSPWFSLGPFWGLHLAVFSHVLIVLGLSLFNAYLWRHIEVSNIRLGPMMMLLPFFSASMAWTGKFTPDVMSILLACIAVGLSWNGRRLALASLVGMVALLLKPTAAPVFALILLKPDWSTWKRDLTWIFFALAPALWYFTHGIKWIQSYQDSSTVFLIRQPQPLKYLLQYFSEPMIFLKYFIKRLFSPYLPWVMLIGLFQLWRHPLFLKAAFILLIQWIAIIIIGGPVILGVNDYYQICLAPIACLLFWLWLNSGQKKIVLILALALWLGHAIELSGSDLKALKKAWWTEPVNAQTLIQRNPEAPWGKGQPWRSPLQPYPELGLLFGERQNSSSAPWGFYRFSDPLPQGCRAVDRRGELQLVRCSSPNT